MDPIRESRRAARQALVISLGAAALSWLLFLVGYFIRLTHEIRHDWEYGDPELFNIGRYFTIAAITVLGIGALIAKRRTTRIRASIVERSKLVDAVGALATVFLIVAAALTVFVVLVIFVSYYVGAVDQHDPYIRLLNIYLPIVLYAALLITIILAGFVFQPRVDEHTLPRSSVTEAAGEPDPAPHGAAGNDTTGVAAPNLSEQTRRATALAYAVPVIAAAIALILGLIVYDLTQASLEVWVWVLISAMLGAGLFLGSKFSHQYPAGTATGSTADTQLPTVVVGARVLNFVLSLMFIVFVSIMSLGYGAAAIAKLDISPSLTLHAYSLDDGISQGPQSIELSLWGNDLQPDTDAVATLTPGGKVLFTDEVNSYRGVSRTITLTSDPIPGEYEVVARAIAGDGSPIQATLPFTITEGLDVVLPPLDSLNGEEESERRVLLPITAHWFIAEAFPAMVLLALGIASIAATISVQNRDQLRSGTQSGGADHSSGGDPGKGDDSTAATT